MVRVVLHQGILLSGFHVLCPVCVAEEEEEDAAARGAATEDDKGVGRNFKYGLLHNFARLDLSA